MEWCVTSKTSKINLEIPSYLLENSFFEVFISNHVYHVKWVPSVQTFFIKEGNHPLEKVIPLRNGQIVQNPAGGYLVTLEISGNETSFFEGRIELAILQKINFKRGIKEDSISIKSSITGKVLKVFMQEGSTVQEGETLGIVEAMKMENRILAPASGVIKQNLLREGSNISAGELLAVIKTKDSSSA